MAHKPDRKEDWATLGMLIVVFVLVVFETFFNIGVQLGTVIGAGMH